MQKIHSFLALPLVIALAACGGDAKKTDVKADAKAEAPKADAPKADAPKADAPKADAPVEMIEHDLASADPEWAGWVAKGPKEGKVMQDGIKGARIAAGRAAGFDLAFAPKHTDLATLKESLEKGASASEGKLKLTFTTETPEALEWTADGYGAVKYNFVRNMKAGDREVTCKNNYMVGIASQESLARHKEACDTLQKKG
ncbi:hypothetical protein [Nannocystis bainbridge]|uniref:Lipoprotein n=1 Tax=Nannocystis bainbridge TaxID=2995303 RepID=A0ABT5DS48_9BACT|nr:hypothetical protein [Nannocystis bainbridge]MDC0715884.1 hypothetical protein [Nannocystis bainbridge]